VSQLADFQYEKMIHVPLAGMEAVFNFLFVTTAYTTARGYHPLSSCLVLHMLMRLVRK